MNNKKALPREGLRLQGTLVASKEVGGVSRPLGARVTRVPAALSQHSTPRGARLCGRMRRMPLGRLCLPVTRSALPSETGSFPVKKTNHFYQIDSCVGHVGS